MTMLAELIPAGFFEARSEWLLWLIAGGSIALLVVGADRVVSGAARLALAIGMPTVIIGATVVSLGTTSPEAVVSVRAAIGGNPGLALGNGIGSIICDTALIFGLCCLLRRLPADRFVLNRHGWVQFGAGLLLTVIMLGLWLFAGDRSSVFLPRWIGIGFLVLLAAYMAVSVHWSKQHPSLIPDEAKQAQAVAPTSKGKSRALVYLLLLAGGLALVVLGSEFLIGSVTVICERRGVPQAVLAVTLVAFGTSLPELVTAIAAILKGHTELLVGNILGADILNVLFVIGASASAVPLQIDPVTFKLSLPMMMLVLLMMRLFGLFSRGRFHRWQGVPLLVSYVVFIYILATHSDIGHP